MQQAVLQILAGDPTYRDDGELSPFAYRQFLEASGMPIVVFERGDRGSLVQFVNRAFSKRTGYATEEICGSNWWAMHKAPGNEQALADLWGAMCCGRELKIQLRSHCKDGSWFWSQLHLSPVSEHGEAPRYYLGVLRDISDEHDRLEDLTYSAFHDALTGLANRRLLVDRFDQVATNARRRTHEFRLALIDLDGFKSINDTFGHRAGDELLRTIGTRLTHSMRVEDTVARLGGDEFAVLIQSSYDLDSAQAVDARIRELIEQPVMIDGRPLCPSCSIGVSLSPSDGFEFELLLEHADRNMYKQKLEHRRHPSVAPKCRYPGAATGGEAQTASCQRVDHALSAECMGRACWVRELEPMV